MKFSYNWIQSYFSKKLPKPDDLAEILTLGSFEVKDIAKDKGDYILEMDVTPNRPDCLSYEGIAREVHALTGMILNNSLLKIIPNAKAGSIKVKNEEPKECLRYCGREMFNVKVGESSKLIKDRLIANGLQPINSIVDSANYVMLETGQPLHVFDAQKLEGNQIIIRHAKKGEEIDALDENKYKLDENVLVIADGKKPLAIAGVKGGKNAAISKYTKHIFIESANFGYKGIRKTSRKLGLRTDASVRYEYGIDRDMCNYALDKFCSLVKGDISKAITDIYPSVNRLKPRTIKFDLSLIKKTLGLEIPLNQVVSILKSLDIKTIKKNSKALDLLIPTFRPDLKIPEDIIEELARAYGLNRIQSNLPVYPITIPKRNESIYWESHIKNILKELGFIETYNYSFISQKDARGIDNLIELENPASDEFRYLRPNLIFNLLKLVGFNLRIKQIQGKRIGEYLQLFEVGNAFKKTKTGIEEKRMLTGLIWAEKEKNGFLCAKSLLEMMLKELGISSYYLDVDQNSSDENWIKSKTAEINIDGKTIGHLGAISLKTLKRFDSPQWVFAFDIELEKLIKECDEENEFEEIPKFPAAIRDISILLPREVRVAKVLKLLDNVADNLKDADLLDMYEGKELPSGKKNLTFRLIFQAKDKTLSGQEIDLTMQKIIKELEKNPGWGVRK